MADVEALQSPAAWDALWAAQAAADAPPALVFKRSPTCPISRRAEEAFERFAASPAAGTPLRLYRVDVIAARPASQKIAADTGVKHESPQALLLGPGRKVLWHASHHAIDEQALAKAVTQPEGTGGKAWASG
jgi:bacillithiol system protein YtxJ